MDEKIKKGPVEDGPNPGAPDLEETLRAVGQDRHTTLSARDLHSLGAISVLPDGADQTSFLLRPEALGALRGVSVNPQDLDTEQLLTLKDDLIEGIRNLPSQNPAPTISQLPHDYIATEAAANTDPLAPPVYE